MSKKFWPSLLFRSAGSRHRTIWARLRYSCFDDSTYVTGIEMFVDGGVAQI